MGGQQLDDTGKEHNYEMRTRCNRAKGDANGSDPMLCTHTHDGCEAQ